MPDRMKNTITDAPPGRGLDPRAKRLDHDVDVIQEHYQRPEPSQAVKRQDALLVTRHHRPFLRAFEQSVPLYTLMDLAYILTRKTPRSGGFGGLAHLYVRCPKGRDRRRLRPRRHPPYSASGHLAADDLVNEDGVAVLGTGRGEAHEHAHARDVGKEHGRVDVHDHAGEDRVMTCAAMLTV